MLQSNYIPWKGCFDLIRHSDLFLFYDDVQYTRRDWRNRNKIVCTRGKQATSWLTIPVNTSNFFQSIDQTKVAQSSTWIEDHWNILESHYKKKAPYFEQTSEWLYPIYKTLANESFLSVINQTLLKAICKYLDITTPMKKPTDYISLEKFQEMPKEEIILEICKCLKVSHYLVGPKAKSYLDEDFYIKNGIRIIWANYDDYKEYPQCGQTFSHAVSIIDMLMNVGKTNAKRYLKEKDSFFGM